MLNNLLILKNWQEKNSYNKVSHTLLFKKQFTLRLNGTLVDNKSNFPKVVVDSEGFKQLVGFMKSESNYFNNNNNFSFITSHYLISKFKLKLLFSLMKDEIFPRENYPLATQTFGLDLDPPFDAYFDELNSALGKPMWWYHPGYYEVPVLYGYSNWDNGGNASIVLYSPEPIYLDEFEENEPFTDIDKSRQFFDGFEESVMKWCMENKYMICELPAALSTKDMVDLLLRLTNENEGTFLPFYHKNILTTNKEIKSITYCGEELFFNPIKTDDEKLLQVNECMRVFDSEYTLEEKSGDEIEFYSYEITSLLLGEKLRDFEQY